VITVPAYFTTPSIRRTRMLAGLPVAGELEALAHNLIERTIDPCKAAFEGHRSAVFGYCSSTDRATDCSLHASFPNAAQVQLPRPA
jgi:hypothetical protein